MQLSDIMRTRVVTIGPEDTADAAWTRMRRRGIRHLVVMDGPELVGVISERDLGGRSGAGVRKGRSVRSLMSRSVASASPDTSLEDAADLMRRELIGSLPVTEDGELVGLVTATDVFEALGNDARSSLSRAERSLLRAPSSSRKLGGRPVPRARSRAGGVARVAGEGALTRSRSATGSSSIRTASEADVSVRVSGVTLGDDEREYLRRRLRDRLGKYAGSIERVTVRVKDVNGPRGGVDKACRIKVVLGGFPSVVYEHQAPSLKFAVTGALNGVERAVKRLLERRRP